ncbi:MAG: FmdB family zinc ribbon protein [Ktedonobacterales bacterium]
MPLYEFRCRDCGSRFEVLTSYQQSLGEMTCTVCQSQNVRKLVPLIARRGKAGDGDDFTDGGDDWGDGGDMDDMDEIGAQAGGCNCGGACTCRD